MKNWEQTRECPECHKIIEIISYTGDTPVYFCSFCKSTFVGLVVDVSGWRDTYCVCTNIEVDPFNPENNVLPDITKEEYKNVNEKGE